MKALLFSGLLIVIITWLYMVAQPKSSTHLNKIKTPPSAPKKPALLHELNEKASNCKAFLKQKGFSTHYIFLVDMSLPSGRNRFFIYDLRKDTVVRAGLVAHGSCGTEHLPEPRFSNVPGCGCSSIGKYKIGAAYQGRFGKAFKLYGSDSSNSNAFTRAIVLHGYHCVPDREVYPYPICNSLGCPMVSYKLLNDAAAIIEASEKPILLWIYN